jgi:hypothetical protein
MSVLRLCRQPAIAGVSLREGDAMTNRERALQWLLDTYPSAWEADHVTSLAALLDEVAIAATVRASGGGTSCCGTFAATGEHWRGCPEAGADGARVR